jgi:hypothetical protein
LPPQILGLGLRRCAEPVGAVVDEERSRGCADTANSPPLPARARSATQTSTSGTSVSARQPQRRLETIPARTTEQLTANCLTRKRTRALLHDVGDRVEADGQALVNTPGPLEEDVARLRAGGCGVKSATSESHSSLVRAYWEHNDDDGIRPGCQRHLKTDHHAASKRRATCPPARAQQPARPKSGACAGAVGPWCSHPDRVVRTSSGTSVDSHSSSA